MTVPVYDQYLTKMGRGDIGLPPEPWRHVRCGHCGATTIHTDPAEHARWVRKTDQSIARYNARRAVERAHG